MSESTEGIRDSRHASAQSVEDDAGPWREGALLIARPGSELLDRCVICDHPAEGRRMQKESVAIGVCSRHLRRHSFTLKLAWVLLSLAVVALVASILLPSGFQAEPVTTATTRGVRVSLSSGWFLIFLVSLAGAVWCFASARVLSTKKRDSRYVRFKGASPSYLDRLPGSKVPL